MKTSKALLFLILFIAFINTLTINAQNTFPASGNVGIGVPIPDVALTLANASSIKIKDPSDPAWGTVLKNDAIGNGFLTVAGNHLTLQTGWNSSLNLNGGKSIYLGTNGGDERTF